MDGDALPHQLLRDASLTMLHGQIRPRLGTAFVVDWQGTPAVLRSTSPIGPETPGASIVDGVRWQHALLSRLTALGFPAPQPLPAFAGNSWTVADGVLWELVSFLPGNAVGWSPRPPMEEIGALLARYHATAEQTRIPGQRPSALPLAQVPGVLMSALDNAGVAGHHSTVIRNQAEQLSRDLCEIAPRHRELAVIHGDFTTTTSSPPATRRPRPA